MKLKESSLVPLYRQVSDIVKSRIADGVYAQGDRIPSEAEFSEEFSVSRVTVRHAINELVKTGYLQPRQGKGTFVMDKCNASKTPLKCMPASITGDGAFAEEAMEARLISHGIEPTQREDQAFFGPESSVAYISLVYEKDGLPLLEEHILVPADKASSEVAGDFSVAPAFALVENYTGLKPTTCRLHRVEVEPASTELAAALGVGMGDPLLSECMGMLDQHDEPLCMVKRYFPGSQYLLEL